MTHLDDDGSAARFSASDATLSVATDAPVSNSRTPPRSPAGLRIAPGSPSWGEPSDSLSRDEPAARSEQGPRPRSLPDMSERILVMAIVNRTRDSFYDDGRTWDLDTAIEAGQTAAAEGADIIDVGGVRFAPGDPLPVTEEIDRVVPVIRALRERLPDVLLSVDTFHAEVARAAIAVGADIINDTTGLFDPAMASTVAESGAAIVLTHSLANPRQCYPSPRYEDVVEEVRDFLAARIERSLEAGIPRRRIILDPGPDLNKSTVQTLEMLRDWNEYSSLGLPVLAALSRKDVIGESLGLPKEERLEGSLAAAAWVLRQGTRILRVHDVQSTVRMVRMFEVLSGWRDPAGPLVHNV